MSAYWVLQKPFLIELESTVPKHEVHHHAGRLLQTELKESLLKYFNESDIKKLERLGGRILFSITAPYTNRKKRDNHSINIDEDFVRKLESLKNSPDEAQEILDSLTVKNLRMLANLIGQPVRSNATASEIRSEIMRFIQAEDFWYRISGTVREKT